jgi:hypothetical protein
MSRTHKPNPPEKGDSAPKPSRKVAIEEVLRSLQDLVNNELSVDASKPEPTADAVPPGNPVPKSGISNPFPPASARARTDAGENVPIDLEVLPEIVPETAPTPPEPAHITKEQLPPEGLQQELPYLEPEAAIQTSATAAVEPSPLLVEPEFPSPELPGTDELDDRSVPDTIDVKVKGIEPAGLSDPPIPASPADDIREPEPVASGPSLETSGAGASPAVAHDDGPNDLPVLEDAVDLHDEPEPHQVPDESSLPAAQDGRRLAIQVAARLNVELRKAGQPGLSSDVIARLARLLEETLAKGAPNMENSTKPKH